MAATTSHLRSGPRKPADAFPRRGWLRRWRVIAAAALTSVLVVAAALIWLGAQSADDSKTVGLEAAKAGFQLLVLAVAGLGVTGVLEWFSRKQEERRRVNDAAVELLRDLIESYNELKGTRRVLRALGLHKGSPMSSHQRDALEQEMRKLVGVQLTFERIGREIGVRLEEDDTPRRTTPQTLLAGMEAYVKEIVNEWETEGIKAASGQRDLRATMGEMPCLSGFLQQSRDDPDTKFRTNVSVPLRDIENFFRSRLIVPISLADEPYEDVSERRAANSSGP
jgi:hypothetical protein